MKKKLHRFYRHTMRRLARWFLGFWDCPATLKKDRKAEVLNTLIIVLVTVGTIVLLGGFALLLN